MILHKNKRAYFDYEILKEYKAGIVLTGSEVKACRDLQVNFRSAYVSIRDNNAILKQSQISQYKYDNSTDYQDNRDRILLLNKKEIAKIRNELNTAGISLIPIEMYTDRKYVKVKIALVRGKKKYDKRESIKKRELIRKIRD